MIETQKGDIRNVTKGIIIHGCNAQGVMGSGVALSIKTKWPGAFTEYKQSVDHIGAANSLGSISIYNADEHLMIVNAVTQFYYGQGKRFVNYEALTRAFETTRLLLMSHPGFDLYFPAIGAGLGGGNWKIISTIIDETIPDNLARKVLCVL